MTVVPLHAKGGNRGSLARKGGTVAGLDIGSNKISCIIAEIVPPRQRNADSAERNDLRVLGVGHQLSRGVRAGSVVNVDEAERAIRLAVDAAERMAQQTVGEVHVNVSGGRPQSRLYTAKARTATGQVSPRDIDNLTSAAIAQVDPGRRSILHISPVQYHLDDARGISSPLGMHGDALSLELGVVTVDPGHLKNLQLAVERAHLGIAGFVISPYAASRSVLAEDELSLGVTLIDMGGATTSFAIFNEGRLAHAETIPVGGQHITNDIAAGLHTTIAHAERMKTLWGSALASQTDDRDMISVPLLGERGSDTVQKVPKSMLTGIIRPRLEETFELVRDRIEASGLSQMAGRHVVLTGGASQLTGAREVAAHWLDRHIRLGSPLHIAGMPEFAHAPGFAVSAGLVNHALKPDADIALPESRAGETVRVQNGYMRKVGRWIIESL